MSFASSYEPLNSQPWRRPLAAGAPRAEQERGASIKDGEPMKFVFQRERRISWNG
jgi:hypothetical protein